MKYIIKYGKITSNEYQKLTSSIRRTVQRDLALLVEKKLVHIVGKSHSDPTKYYVLV